MLNKKASLIGVIGIITIFSDNSECFLKNGICISSFEYSHSTEKTLYRNREALTEDEKLNWIYLHSIYPKNEIGFWNNCTEISYKSIACSFQQLVNIKECVPLSIDRYPIENWRLKFYEITILDNYQFEIKNYTGRKNSWIEDQYINVKQEVLCDS